MKRFKPPCFTFFFSCFLSSTGEAHFKQYFARYKKLSLRLDIVHDDKKMNPLSNFDIENPYLSRYDSRTLYCHKNVYGVANQYTNQR